MDKLARREPAGSKRTTGLRTSSWGRSREATSAGKCIRASHPRAFLEVDPCRLPTDVEAGLTETLVHDGTVGISEQSFGT
jgi:hypothetical protein